MNTYFYAAAASVCSNVCNFATCSYRCLSLLDRLPALQGLKILPGGSMFRTPTSMELRSGDIIILFAKNILDIESLICLKDFLERFRIILIVGEENILNYGKHHCLNPRYTTCIGKNMNELSIIIDRILAGPTHADDLHNGFQEQTYA